MSASIIPTFLPIRASAIARLAASVDLPTPPLPLPMAMRVRPGCDAVSATRASLDPGQRQRRSAHPRARARCARHRRARRVGDERRRRRPPACASGCAAGVGQRGQAPSRGRRSSARDIIGFSTCHCFSRARLPIWGHEHFPGWGAAPRPVQRHQGTVGAPGGKGGGKAASRRRRRAAGKGPWGEPPKRGARRPRRAVDGQLARRFPARSRGPLRRSGGGGGIFGGRPDRSLMISGRSSASSCAVAAVHDDAPHRAGRARRGHALRPLQPHAGPGRRLHAARADRPRAEDRRREYPDIDLGSAAKRR
jgi:hypothetical protein